MAVKMTADNLADALKSFADLASQRVVVGIPEASTERKEDGAITNAQIAYVQENGSAANNLPARPRLLRKPWVRPDSWLYRARPTRRASG